MLSKLEIFSESCALMDQRGIVVRNELCLHTRHQASNCLRCSSVCPTGAIRFDNGLVFTAGECSGCGACTTVCPSGALSGKLPSNAEVRQAVKRHIALSGAVAFACETWLDKHPAERDRVVALQCIARLDESVLADAVLGGAAQVAILDGACAQCPQGKLRRLAQHTADTVNNLLGHWQYKSAIAISHEVPTELRALPPAQDQTAGVSRRGFFSFLRSRGAGLASTALPGMLSVALGRREDNPNANRLVSGQTKMEPERHRHLVDALRKLATTPLPREFASKLWAELSITPDCIGCAACAEACPSGALAAVTCDALWGIFHESSRCTHCGLCVNICPRKCIQMDSTVMLDLLLKQQPRLLAGKDRKEVENLSEPMASRVARMFEGVVHW